MFRRGNTNSVDTTGPPTFMAVYMILIELKPFLTWTSSITDTGADVHTS